MTTKKITDIKDLALALTELDTGKQEVTIANMHEILADLSDLISNQPDIITILGDNAVRRNTIKKDSGIH